MTRKVTTIPKYQHKEMARRQPKYSNKTKVAMMYKPTFNRERHSSEFHGAAFITKDE